MSLKNFKDNILKHLPKTFSAEDVLLWFQDEARFGQRNTTTRLWAPRGTRPRAVQQQQFEYAYLFGAVCMTTGETEALVTPVSNMAVMAEHLSLISKATPEGKHSVVIMDQARWHQAHLAHSFPNLTLVHLPPYSPELNAIERVWSWMRQNALANRCFDDYNDIVESVCQAWNRFREDKNRVKSLCFRSWALLAS